MAKNKNLPCHEVQYSFVAPNGQVYRGKNLTKFCKKNGLNYRSMLALKLGVQKSHKGWRKYIGAHTGRARKQELAIAGEVKPQKSDRRKLPQHIRKRNRLVVQHLNLAKILASIYSKGTIGLYDDLLQVARLALIEAAERYEDKGFKFSTYAQHWIKYAIKNYLEQEWEFQKHTFVDALPSYRAYRIAAIAQNLQP